MYVSYDFYKQTFGDTVPEADFSKVEAKAEAVIGSPSTRRAWIEI